MRDRDQRPSGVRDHAPVGALVRRVDRLPDVLGNLGGAEEAERIRREGGWLGRGPTVVVTDLGIYRFDDRGEMRLDRSIQARPSTRSSDRSAGSRGRRSLSETPPPTAEELRLIREELDPGGVYTK